jgi:hypothetical protein
MRALNYKLLVTIIMVTALLACVAKEEDHFLAFSLKEAARQLKEGRRTAELMELGGITRLSGMVYDGQNNDFIMVGLVKLGEPRLNLDDLVVAVRARLLKEEWPSVSIDKTPEMMKTGKQLVRFGGGVENTKYGSDLLKADVVLKKIGLGLIPTNVAGVKSYFDLSVDYIKQGKGLEEVISTRFWFYPLDPALAKREDVFAIKELRVGVVAQVMGARVKGKPVGNLETVKDAVGEGFCLSFTQHYQDLALNYPEIGALRKLFDMVALAEGIRAFRHKADMNYWLHEYKVAPLETPIDYPLLKRGEKFDLPDRVRVMEIDGGIELKALVSNLQDGDVTALKDIVLKSRPDGNVLRWRVPLEGWALLKAIPLPIPGAVQPGTPLGPPAQPKEIGCSLERQIRPINDPAIALQMSAKPADLPGMNMKIYDGLGPGGVLIDSKPIKIGRGGKSLREEALGTPHSPDSLSW